MIHVVRYTPDRAAVWNKFVDSSKNGTFLFHRNYMEYHADRFTDHSFVFYDDKGEPVGLMPACVRGDEVVSHAGLTFGGVVVDVNMKTAHMLRLFTALLNHLREEGVRRLVYKAVPDIFHRIPSGEDLYALYVNNARLCRRDASSAILLADRPKFSKGKREGVSKAVKAGIEVRETTDYRTFFEIGIEVMRQRHNVSPVHTAEEMSLLGNHFPSNIRLFGGYRADRMLAGVIVYVHAATVHIQYMYNSEEGLGCGALDIIIHHLITETFANYRYMSFGVSTESNGLYLNEGLVQQKEMFGARCIVHDFYEIDL